MLRIGSLLSIIVPYFDLFRLTRLAEWTPLFRAQTRTSWCLWVGPLLPAAMRPSFKRWLRYTQVWTICPCLTLPGIRCLQPCKQYRPPPPPPPPHTHAFSDRIYLYGNETKERLFFCSPCRPSIRHSLSRCIHYPLVPRREGLTDSCVWTERYAHPWYTWSTALIHVCVCDLLSMQENYKYLKEKLKEVASRHGERVLNTPNNPISIGQ